MKGSSWGNLVHYHETAKKKKWVGRHEKAEFSYLLFGAYNTALSWIGRNVLCLKTKKKKGLKYANHPVANAINAQSAELTPRRSNLHITAFDSSETKPPTAKPRPARWKK